MPTTPRKAPSPRGTTPMPETPAKRKLVGIEQAASPRTAPGRKKRRDDHTAVGGADTEAEVLNYLGRFRATGEPASGEQALVVLLRGVLLLQRLRALGSGAEFAEHEAATSLSYHRGGQATKRHPGKAEQSERRMNS